MENRNKQKSGLSRRKFLGNTATIAAFSMMPVNYFSKNTAAANAIAGATPNSNFGGVQIGAITYSWRGMPGGVDNVIKYCTEAGISSIELMSTDVEETLGAPKNPRAGMFGPPPSGAQPPAGAPAATAAPGTPPAGAQTSAGAPGAPPAGAPQRRELTPEQQAAAAKYAQDLKAWRLALPMSKVEEVRKLFENAGIKIHIVIRNALSVK